MTSLFETPDTPELLRRTDSPVVGDALVRPKDVGARDSRTSTRPGDQYGAIAGADGGEDPVSTPGRPSGMVA